MSEMQFGLGVDPFAAGYQTGANTAWDLMTGRFDEKGYARAVEECRGRTAIVGDPGTNSLDRESYGRELRYWRGVVAGMDSERK